MWEPWLSSLNSADGHEVVGLRRGRRAPMLLLTPDGGRMWRCSWATTRPPLLDRLAPGPPPDGSSRAGVVAIVLALGAIPAVGITPLVGLVGASVMLSFWLYNGGHPLPPRARAFAFR